MVKHTQTNRRQQSTDCTSVLNHLVGLTLKGLINYRSFSKIMTCSPIYGQYFHHIETSQLILDVTQSARLYVLGTLVFKWTNTVVTPLLELYEKQSHL